MVQDFQPCRGRPLPSAGRPVFLMSSMQCAYVYILLMTYICVLCKIYLIHTIHMLYGTVHTYVNMQHMPIYMSARASADAGQAVTMWGPQTVCNRGSFFCASQEGTLKSCSSGLAWAWWILQSLGLSGAAACSVRCRITCGRSVFIFSCPTAVHFSACLQS